MVVRVSSRSAVGRACLLCDEHRAYVTAQIRRRGLVHRARRAEGWQLVRHLVAIELLSLANLPEGWPATRALLDRAVYRAVLELRPRLASLPESFEGPWARDVPVEEGPGLEGWSPAAALRDLIERLPVAPRLLVKLKHAEVFWPDLPAGPSPWREDETSWLLERHRGRSLASIEAELRDRLAREPHRQRGKVPSTVLTWLLGRASPAAVDAAYHAIKAQLRRSMEVDAAVVFPARCGRGGPGVTLRGCRFRPSGREHDHGSSAASWPTRYSA
jgi:hypothetical protein